MTSSSQKLHQSVLLEQAVDVLQVKPSGVYVDATFGRGGHSQAILSRLGTNGRLFAFDVDPDAILYGKQYLQDPRLTLIHAPFSQMNQYLVDLGVSEVDGVLADLGVSSPQFDQAQRGFSFQADAPLDMRMNPETGEPVSVFLNHATHAEIATVLRKYGQEPSAGVIASLIVQRRQEVALTNTLQLAQWVLEAKKIKSRAMRTTHPATQTFQALRIWVNKEQEELEMLLQEVPKILSVGGRWAIISFHSLEDRLVKHVFNDLAGREGHVWQKQADCQQKKMSPQWKIVGRFLAKEIEDNARARSAVMRVVEFCGGSNSRELL